LFVIGNCSNPIQPNQSRPLGRLVEPMEETLAVGSLAAGETAAAAVGEATEQKEETLEEVLSRHRLASSPRLASLLDCMFCGLDDEAMPLPDVVSIRVTLV
jgi:hypothetical protein